MNYFHKKLGSIYDISSQIFSENTDFKTNLKYIFIQKLDNYQVKASIWYTAVPTDTSIYERLNIWKIPMIFGG